MNKPKQEIQEEKVIIKKKIIRYVNLLYKFLGDKYCFTSGAFVIQDNDEELYNLLYSVYDENLTDIGVYTHTIFKDNSEILYEIHFKKKQLNIDIECKCLDGTKNTKNTRKIKNIKFYKFINNNINFVYLKLESTTTFNPIHLKHMIKRHYNIENESCVDPRREDCSTHENCKYYKDESNKIKKNYSKRLFGLIKNYSNKENSNPNIKVIDDTYDILLDLNKEPAPVTEKKSYDIVKIKNKECDISETYLRKGDEFFIPYCINEFFINNIEDDNIIFEFDNDNNTINIRNDKEQNSQTSNTNGGKTKKIKYIRHYSQRKRKQIKRKKQSNKKRKIKMIHRSQKKF